MKKAIFLFIIFFYGSFSYGSNFKITPILLNLKGVAVKDSITIAFADFGSALISRDREKSWEQKRIFAGGNIVNVFIEDNVMVSFNDRGEVAKSDDAGNSWSFMKKLEDSVLSVIRFPEGYFIRMRNKLITLNNNFEKQNELEINSKFLTRLGFYYTPTYNKSLLFADNKLIAEFDSSVFIRFDLNLSPIDTLKLLDQIKLGEYLSGYRMFFDSNYIYFKYTYNKNGVLGATVFRTNNFKNIEKFADLKSADDYYTIYKGKLYSCSIVLNKKLTDTTKLSNAQINLYFKESSISNDKQYIVGDRKILQILNLQDSSLKVVSDYSDLTFLIPPDLIDEKSYFLYSSSSAIYKTDNNGTTILPTIDKSEPSYQQGFKLYNIKNHYYEKERNKLYLFGNPYITNQGVIWTSENEGKTFDSTYIENLFYPFESPFFRNASLVRGNVQRRDSVFVLSAGWWFTPWKTIYSDIVTFKEDGKAVKRILDSNLTFNYVFSKDTNSYLVHSCDVRDSSSQIIYTANAGKNWQLIHKYPINETIGDVYDIVVKGREYLALVHYDYTNYPIMKGLYIDVVDKETLEFTRLASWGSIDNPEYGNYGISVASDGENAYFSFRDTLFVTNNIFNKDSWNYFLLPENGRIARPLKKFGKKFYCIYTDNNNPYGSGMHWIEPLDTLISVVKEKDTYVTGYLYAMPVSPTPATNFIKTLLFWDSSTDINSIQIKIYNLFGVEISPKNKFTLEPVSSNSGYFIWNCSTLDTGLYFIKISSATKSTSIKVLVSR